MAKKEVEEFLNRCLDNLKSESDGCMYFQFDGSLLYLVATYDAGQNEVIAKIASNPSSLQCDYDVDWCEPVLKFNNTALLIEHVITYCEAEDLANYFYKKYKSLYQQYQDNIVDILE